MAISCSLIRRPRKRGIGSVTGPSFLFGVRWSLGQRDFFRLLILKKLFERSAEKEIAKLLTLEQNDGVLSKRARKKEFAGLSEEELIVIEAEYQRIFIASP